VISVFKTTNLILPEKDCRFLEFPLERFRNWQCVTILFGTSNLAIFQRKVIAKLLRNSFEYALTQSFVVSSKCFDKK
jgi:hypothetical protein